MIKPFPDIELVLVGWLQSQLSAQVCTELAPGFSVPTVHVQKINGINPNFVIDSPIVDIDVYAATRGDANALASQIQNLLLFVLPTQTLPGAIVTGGKTVIGPRWLPYDDTSKRRVSGSYLIHVRAS